MIDEAAVLDVIQREIPLTIERDMPLSEAERLEAIARCVNEFHVQIEESEFDFAETPADIAGVVARAAQDQFMG